MGGSDQTRGRALLFHGFASDAEQTFGRPGWIRSLERAGWTPTAPDLPGHGSSALPASESRAELDEWALQQLRRTAEHHGGPVDLVGYSLGSTVAWTLALAEPSLVRSVSAAGVPAEDHLAALARGENTPETRFLEGLLEAQGAAERLAPLIRAAGATPFEVRQVLEKHGAPAGLVFAARGSDDSLALDPQVLVDAAAVSGTAAPTPAWTPVSLTVEGRDHVSLLPSGEVRRGLTSALERVAAADHS
ncbi:alpha/beta fold hydrolase [Arthrobacter sp. UM1]|uniref:alpha/beta fold hydrolase n=1 Tax=Arthrobacter sp. UM1 TaxID=2766776 RepID=UPI001CF6CB41|nr:alpha/beta fold hydrolase [Arthrobacter sp. UM1]MCB4207266.1 alpha/beta fold hydrolase [Arthrobacter sp. UM1]